MKFWVKVGGAGWGEAGGGSEGRVQMTRNQNSYDPILKPSLLKSVAIFYPTEKKYWIKLYPTVSDVAAHI